MIREANLKDLAAIVELECCGFEPAQRWSEQTWAGELQAQDRFALVWLNEDSRVMAVALFQVSAETADLHRVVVARQYRCKGVGTSLLKAGISRANRLGASRMMLEVNKNNEPAIGLYENFGFGQIANRQNYYGYGLDAIVMELAILAKQTEELSQLGAAEGVESR